MTPPRPAPDSRAATLPLAPDGLLDADEPPAFEVVNGEASRPLLLVCDHASRRIPRALGDLGLGRADLHCHIAWDIGAALVTRHLAERLDACAVLGTYSRLVIDCNRQPGSPDSIPPVSDGTSVPGNQDLDEAAEDARIAAIFEPYHAEITRRVHHLWRVTGGPPALVSIHSFTPTMRDGGAPRPWHVGVLWDHDGRIAVPLMDALARDHGLMVGDNEPYSGWVVGYTVGAHGGSAGLPRVAIEIRQDLIASDTGAADWADRLATALEPILADPALRVVEHRVPTDGQE
ncbi:N-formylglutamate amidohydrolase [Roseospira visakhapatnamensis]|uniref:Putative N-formylglutamate amidohydrolase n=1 Tax=Roseospira visakhapatnamensis TaxID=390880 RepID=A0A7W6RAS6_9PROT|nr:N-formylglutamate amidohydrolase [Roseospira visakhapatnamensis]MBB4264975.1 putative N-formylglutamate amidohydrolase [Roseospira visakhapatnamensis]